MKNKSIKKAAVLFAAALLCIALTGCFAKKVNFSTTDSKYEVTANTSWKDSTGKLAGGSELATLEIANLTQEKYIIAMPFEKSIYQIAWPDLEAYDDAMTPAVIAEYSGTDVISTEKIRLDHYDAIMTKFTLTYDNNKVIAWLYSIETEDDYVTVMGWTLTSKENKYGKEICSIIDSLRAK